MSKHVWLVSLYELNPSVKTSAWGTLGSEARQKVLA
jgi:hypothetical protein